MNTDIKINKQYCLKEFIMTTFGRVMFGVLVLSTVSNLAIGMICHSAIKEVKNRNPEVFDQDAANTTVNVNSSK